MIDTETVTLNLTGDKFSSVCFLESVIAFSPPPEGGSRVEVSVWGVTLLRSKFAGGEFAKCSMLDNDGDCYVAGPSELVFFDVVGGEVSVSLYEQHNADHKTNLLRDINGEVVKQKSCWGEDKNKAVHYHLDGVLANPYGWTSLKVYSMGDVYLSFSCRDVVKLSEYIRDPQKFLPPMLPRQ